MKILLSDYLICPTCLPREIKLALKVGERSGDDVLEGVLVCHECDARYLVADGIAYLFPLTSDAAETRQSKYQREEVISSYLWAHFADLLEDPDSSDSYEKWAAQVDAGGGLALDIGCAVGRFTFELGLKSDLAIGLDSSVGFIRVARELLMNRRTAFGLILEGRLVEIRIIALPDYWDTNKVEFIVGNALALPFPHDCFSFVSSLNLVDKLPKPLKHLEEIDRVARRNGSQFLFSDPFSWSSDICDEKEWLGGSTSGEYAGPGLENVARILEEGIGTTALPWRLGARGGIWWKIRNHRNHFELIRSCFIKAAR
jgi:SAM-dependent methyltransferase